MCNLFKGFVISIAFLEIFLIGCSSTPNNPPPSIEGVEGGILPPPNGDPIIISKELYCLEGPYQKIIQSMMAAHRALTKNPANPEASFLACRSCFWLADWRSDHEARLPSSLKYAELGVEFGKWGIKHDSTRADIYYYYALNLGLELKYSGVGATCNLDELVKLLEKAIELDESYDQGGPLRVLGKIYLKAPAWPSGIGDIDKALQILKKAAQNYPSHPLNHLFLAEALFEDEAFNDALISLSQFKKQIDLTEYYWYAERWKKTAEELNAKIVENVGSIQKTP